MVSPFCKVGPAVSTMMTATSSCFGISQTRMFLKSTSVPGQPDKIGGKALPKDEVFSLSDFDI